ncbi:hypothetical protein L1049_014904 [Liquidambar formosana]|uniref:Uncharacterized protein n=1 Tax=Liquidambar formosana TaxID=63359 RepID=A0AAP0RX49_LIQFO
MGRSPCCAKVGVKRGPWSSKEDQLLTSYIQNHGEGNWRILPQRAGLNRCGKSCRLRWFNYLRPGIKRGNISMDEEDLIIRLHNLLGNRWSLIAGRLPGRTDNEIKNYWNTTLLKKLNCQPSPPSIIHLEPKEKKPVKNCAPRIPQAIRPKAHHIPQAIRPKASHFPQVIRPKAVKCSKVLISPEHATDLLINRTEGCIHNGHASTSSCTLPDCDSLNFLMDFNVDEVLIQDILNSNFSQTHHDEMNGDCNMADEANIYASSVDCPISKDRASAYMECDPIQPSLELEVIKTVASFLDSEDDGKEL